MTKGVTAYPAHVCHSSSCIRKAIMVYPCKKQPQSSDISPVLRLFIISMIFLIYPGHTDSTIIQILLNRNRIRHTDHRP